MHKERLRSSALIWLPVVALLGYLASHPVEAAAVPECEYQVPHQIWENNTSDPSATELYAYPLRASAVIREAPNTNSPIVSYFVDGFLPLGPRSPEFASDGSRWFELANGGWVQTSEVSLRQGRRATTVETCVELPEPEVNDLSHFPVVELSAYFVDPNSEYSNFTWPIIPGGEHNRNLYHLRYPTDLSQTVHIFAAHNYTLAGRMIVGLYRQGGYVRLNLHGQPAVYQAYPFGRYINQSSEVQNLPLNLDLLKVTDPLNESFALYVGLEALS